ncbi:uncharacterized protein Z520_11012 [Fonsecaea multimorphosa CBS 102226]|uniref:SHSP domain-containing protein n=1 Tax=Fonsecaea multimorphosa CBS 102226 TaxID=1442371 RepID=A0A0D2JSG8_9EURO|nr:uncharacterized protein Z520_11012 [Fonsecaea multimorphosa CBS 102226]KIX93369.1 hypothetical protein Z520_11012 [Fonsecaea multimorphosa CBS 102226]OAL18605.1 hypothetical protein AYO22_10582 [Fonsecaea multimorphosa]
MSFLFPRIAFAPARCGPTRRDIAPLLSLFDDSFNEVQRASRAARKQFNPRFDVKESNDAYSLEGELPGIEQKDLSIEFVDEHTLTIKGRTERTTESGTRPQAVEAEKKAAIEETPASETSSVKSHQPTVEDEEPANSSAAAAEDSKTEAAAPTPAPAEQQPTQAEQQQPQQQYWITERSVGEFSRSFWFPHRVNQEAVKASLKNGLLSIVVPKASAPESRRIAVE